MFKVLPKAAFGGKDCVVAHKIRERDGLIVMRLECKHTHPDLAKVDYRVSWMPLLMEEHLTSGATETLAVATPHLLLAPAGSLVLLRDYVVAEAALPHAPLMFLTKADTTSSVLTLRKSRWCIKISSRILHIKP